MNELRSICDRVEVSVRRALSPGRVDLVCESEGGEVTLRGRVASDSDRIFCVIVTRTVPGVRSVKNLIEVSDEFPN